MRVQIPEAAIVLAVFGTLFEVAGWAIWFFSRSNAE
jgi:hypothetical protein